MKWLQFNNTLKHILIEANKTEIINTFENNWFTFHFWTDLFIIY